MQKFKIIYADPPWQYQDKCKAGDRGAEFNYPCTGLSELKKLPIQNLADKDAVLVMWVTWPMLSDALELINAWGFEYKSCGFVWIKRNKNYWQNLALKMRVLFRKSATASDIDTQAVRDIMTEKEFMMGMGAAGTRANTEFCLLAKRGKMSRLTGGISQLFESDPETIIEPHSGRHSEKPDGIRKRIVELFGDQPRIELFSRHQVAGWDRWGNDAEATSTINLENYEHADLISNF